MEINKDIISKVVDQVGMDKGAVEKFIEDAVLKDLEYLTWLNTQNSEHVETDERGRT